MNHLHKLLNLNNSDIVKIHITTEANVMLMDPKNYLLYLNDQKYDYYGKVVKRSPFSLRPPHAGNWHLVIEQADSSQDLGVNVQIISEPERE